MNKAVFLDKDGTLIPDIPYNANPALITLEKGVVQGLRKLQEAGYILVVISNQSGIARGYFTEEDFRAVQQKLIELLRKEGIELSGFYYCPHHQDGVISEYAISCKCRKPQPGMFFKASQDLDIDLPASWMIGDVLNDIEAGNKAGCGTVLIDNGNEKEWFMNADRKPVHIAGNIIEAAELILLSPVNKS